MKLVGKVPLIVTSKIMRFVSLYIWVIVPLSSIMETKIPWLLSNIQNLFIQSSTQHFTGYLNLMYDIVAVKP